MRSLNAIHIFDLTPISLFGRIFMCVCVFLRKKKNVNQAANYTSFHRDICSTNYSIWINEFLLNLICKLNVINCHVQLMDSSICILHVSFFPSSIVSRCAQHFYQPYPIIVSFNDVSNKLVTHFSKQIVNDIERCREKMQCSAHRLSTKWILYCKQWLWQCFSFNGKNAESLFFIHSM